MKVTNLLGSTMLALSLAATSAQAATLNQTFMNEFDANALYFWADDATNLQFAGASFGANMTQWTVTANTGEALVLEGPTTVPAASGRFTLQLDYVTRPFSLQWAEVFFDSGVNRILAGGTLSYTSGGWVGSNVFTHAADVPYQFSAQAAVPLPQSVVLMLSALVFLPLRRLTRARVHR